MNIHSLMSRKSSFWDFLVMTTGAAIYSLCLVVFIQSAGIIVGGLTGLCLVANYLYALPVGLLVIIINIPLFFISYKYFGSSFLLKTAYATVMASVLIDVFQAYIPKFSGNVFLALFYGGVGMGLGIGLILLRGASMGGSEIICKILTAKTSLSFGSANLIFCGATIIIAALIYGRLESAMYAVILEFIISRVIDAIVFGFNESTGVFIITSKPEQIAQIIMRELDRGVTSVPAVGMYSRSERSVLICAVRKNQAQALKKIINSTDSSAFVLITTMKEVYGEGFRQYDL